MLWLLWKAFGTHEIRSHGADECFGNASWHSFDDTQMLTAVRPSVVFALSMLWSAAAAHFVRRDGEHNSICAHRVNCPWVAAHVSFVNSIPFCQNTLSQLNSRNPNSAFFDVVLSICVVKWKLVIICLVIRFCCTFGCGSWWKWKPDSAESIGNFNYSQSKASRIPHLRQASNLVEDIKNRNQNTHADKSKPLQA